MAETALTFLLEQLNDVLKWHTDLVSGFEDELNQLSHDLRPMKTLLSGAGEGLNTIAAFQEIERQIREVVYEVEDTIDVILTQAASRKSSIRRKISFMFREHKIKMLREHKIKPLSESINRFFDAQGSAGASAEQPPSRPRREHSIRRDKTVGFEYEEAEVIGYLMEKKEELDVISIIGMSGLGKTTLARKIFEHEKICYEFPTRIWVYISERLNIRDVFINILREFTSHHMSDLRDEVLSQTVGHFLAERKFLLVLDDVWSPEDWNIIKDALPISNGLSKVMITSRNQMVGVHAKVGRDPQMLRFLSPDESWKLLQLEVFGNENGCPQEFVNIGMEIASCCRGVPLIIVLVGGLLFYLPINKWEIVSKNLSAIMHHDTGRHILDVVEMSYSQLPSYWRECFLYMGVFPEDHSIPAWMLTRLWIAEGFIRPKDGSSLEEVAEEILGDLLSRNLLMLDQTNPKGEIKTCRVHDMIRIFCKERAAEENLFQEIGEKNLGDRKPLVFEVQKFHRLCLHSYLNNLLSENPSGLCVRSFLCLYKEPVDVEPQNISAIPDGFRLLRVLESTSIRFHRFPAKVTKLIHLRYLTLQIEDLTVLPDPLSQLWNLQTLVIETKSRTIKMKANLWKMYRLRHLKTKAAIVLDPKWDGEGGENLQTLSRLAPASCTEKLSKRACNIKELGIRGNLATLFSTMSMENLCLLEKLKLMNEPLDIEHLLVGLPQPKCFPPKLKRLTLSNTFLEWKHISTLAEINTLEVLKLKDNAFVGISWVATDVSFPSLLVLLILKSDLVVWEASPDSFPRLSCLVVKNCANLIEIPPVLAKSLEKLEIENLRLSAVESARNIRADKRAAEELEKSKSKLPFVFSISYGY